MDLEPLSETPSICFYKKYNFLRQGGNDMNELFEEFLLTTFEVVTGGIMCFVLFQAMQTLFAMMG